jgi:hypothetical protein
MPEEAREEQPKSASPNHDQSSKRTRSSESDTRSDCCDDWRCCEPPRHCGPPPYWDPCWGPPPYHGRHHHDWRHHCWPTSMPGGEFFEAMMHFAASTAGYRERWWREMADAARYARKDYMCRDSYWDPCAPYPSHCQPSPWSYCDPCAPEHGRRDVSEAPDPINIKELRAALEADRNEKLRKIEAALKQAESSELANKSPELANKLRKDLAEEAAKADAVIDAVIHDVKLARVAEAMRRKQWSREPPRGRRY